MLDTEKRTGSIGVILTCAVSVVLTAGLLMGFLKGAPQSAASVTVTADVRGKFSMFVANQLSDALVGVKELPKTYTLSDSDIAAPKPNPDCFGVTQDPQAVLAEIAAAERLLDGQELYFSSQTNNLEGRPIRYYRDETILMVTWKQKLDGSMYTFSEVKIADASQFRRFLADGVYGSSKQYLTTDMANSVNAVVASSGDFYQYRQVGMVVYEGTVRRMNSTLVDSCLIDGNGDMQFIRKDTQMTQEEAQKYVDDNGIRFSLSFGPIMVEDGQVNLTPWYSLGQVDDEYCRAGLCQMGKLHYLLAVASTEEDAYHMPTIAQFARQLQMTGCDKAYALDGGQTATIAVQGETVNRVAYGSQRLISDIIYFATALPEGG